jgi:CheY-like chemotaxis protein
MDPRMIFIADDDPEDQAIILEAMDDLAKNIILFFSNGEEIIKGLLELPATTTLPGLIVLDLNMPKINGREVLEFIKNDKRFSAIPVIIYSTSVNIFEKEKCMKLGAQDYIIKPLSFQESREIAKIFYNFVQENSGSEVLPIK